MGDADWYAVLNKNAVVVRTVVDKRESPESVGWISCVRSLMVNRSSDSVSLSFSRLLLLDLLEKPRFDFEVSKFVYEGGEKRRSRCMEYVFDVWEGV